jgi:hypothetical protein
MNMKNLLSLLFLLALTTALLVPAASGTDSSATVANETPVVDGVSLSSTISPTSGSTTAASVTVTVSDGNGYQDITTVSVTVYKPDGETIHVATASATSNGDGSGTSQTYAYSFAMQFHDDPATGASTYKVRATATDAEGATSAPTTATFNYAELAALQLGSSSIAFGTVAPGQRSDVQTLTITNHGNVVIDLTTSGSVFTTGAGQTIAASAMKYDLANADMTTEQSLTTEAFTNTGFALAKGPSSSKDTHWQFAVPSGASQYVRAGDYTGTVAIGAVKA